MFHSSRTTLRELKKRYLNILKKCFLINMGLLLCTTTAFAESAYIMKETGVGGLLVPEYDSNTNTLVDKYYEITMTEYEEIVKAKEAELLSNPDDTEEQKVDPSMEDLDDIPREDFSANHDDAPKVV